MASTQADTSRLADELAKAGVGVRRITQDEDRRQVLIAFHSSADLAAFLNIISRYVPEGEAFYQRIFGGEGSPRAWVYSAFPVDMTAEMMPRMDYEALNWRPRPSFSIVVTCRFPLEDAPIILELVRDYNSRSSS